jgi:hypothetical protein
MKQQMRIHYDEEGDFLEIAVGQPTKCIADEVEPGVFLRRDKMTEEIKSVGILDFKKRSKNSKLFDLLLPVHVELNAP